MNKAGLNAAFEKARDFMISNAQGDIGKVFAHDTQYGPLIGVGDSKFMLSKYVSAKNGVPISDLARALWDAVVALPADELAKVRGSLGAEVVAALEAGVHQDRTPAQQLYTVEDLLKLNLPPRKSLIEGMLHVGETIAIVGRQKVGKSRIVQQMALSLVNGEPFLGMPTPGPATVLMIDLEKGWSP